MYDRNALRWDGDQVRLHSGRLVAAIVPDATWSDMWRVRLPTGHVTDMVNLTRAKDAAVTLALAALNRAERAWPPSWGDLSPASGRRGALSGRFTGGKGRKGTLPWQPLPA